jgi:hypothetical protein
MLESEEKLICEFQEKIKTLMQAATYTPLKRRHLLAALSIPKDHYLLFRKALKTLKSSRFLRVVHGNYAVR